MNRAQWTARLFLIAGLLWFWVLLWTGIARLT
jgi:hypothetical protein